MKSGRLLLLGLEPLPLPVLIDVVHILRHIRVDVCPYLDAKLFIICLLCLNFHLAQGYVRVDILFSIEQEVDPVVRLFLTILLIVISVICGLVLLIKLAQLAHFTQDSFIRIAYLQFAWTTQIISLVIRAFANTFSRSLSRPAREEFI